jgi:hypothetical protein
VEVAKRAAPIIEGPLIEVHGVPFDQKSAQPAQYPLFLLTGSAK